MAPEEVSRTGDFERPNFAAMTMRAIAEWCLAELERLRSDPRARSDFTEAELIEALAGAMIVDVLRAPASTPEGAFTWR
jgi:hypothetical protein